MFKFLSGVAFCLIAGVIAVGVYPSDAPPALGTRAHLLVDSLMQEDDWHVDDGNLSNPTAGLYVYTRSLPLTVASVLGYNDADKPTIDLNGDMGYSERKYINKLAYALVKKLDEREVQRRVAHDANREADYFKKLVGPSKLQKNGVIEKLEKLERGAKEAVEKALGTSEK
jgi:hypothetical protein